MYIATSALRISASAASSPPSPALSETAMPTLARMNTSLPSKANGTSSICMIRSATSAAWIPSPPSSRRIANSSPPSRAAVSAARSTFFSRSPTWSRSPSPAACPSESLIVLKSSMSMNSTAIGFASRSCRSIACSTRSRNSARLARLVTGSWNAWCCSCRSNCLRSVMSRVLSTIPRTFGSCSRLVRSVSVARYVPSRWRRRNSRRPVLPSPSPADVRNDSTRVLSSWWTRSMKRVPSSSPGSVPSTREADGLA